MTSHPSRRVLARRVLTVSAGVLTALVLAPLARADEYVVQVGPDQDPGLRAKSDAARVGGKVEFVYRSALRGYALSAAPDQIGGLASATGTVSVERATTYGPAAAPSCPFGFCQFLPRGVD